MATQAAHYLAKALKRLENPAGICIGSYSAFRASFPHTVFASIDDLTDSKVARGLLTCTFSSLASGSSTAQSGPDPDDCGAGTFTNTASVSANESDPKSSNNGATQSVQVPGTSLPNGGAVRNLGGVNVHAKLAPLKIATTSGES